MSRKQAIGAVLGVAALAVPAGAVAAKLKPHGTYQGSTSQVNEAGQHAAITFTVAKSAKKLSKLNIQVRADCQNGPAQYFALPGGNEKIDKKGRFSDSGTVKGNVDGTHTGAVTAVLRGRFKTATKASGTFTATMEIADSTGAVVDHCASGPVTWSAKRSAR